jgi:hypothetical protein
MLYYPSHAEFFQIFDYLLSNLIEETEGGMEGGMGGGMEQV